MLFLNYFVVVSGAKFFTNRYEKCADPPINQRLTLSRDGRVNLQLQQ